MSTISNRHLYLPLTILSLNIALFILSLVSLLVIHDSESRPSILRWILSLVIPCLMAYRGLKRSSIDVTGAAAGVMIGISMCLTSYVSLIALISCYLLTSKATRFGENVKRQFEPNYKKGGQRNWIQVISNLGPANLAVLIRLFYYGSGEMRLDFIHQENYFKSWLLLSSILSIAAALGDTFSSELGPVFSGPNTQPLLITTLQYVPRGTNGGVTIDGFVASCVGGFSIGLLSYISLLFLAPASTKLNKSTPQWPLIHFCLYSGLIGSVLDSFLGATLQYTGFNFRTQKIVEEDPETSKEDSFGSTTKQQISHIAGKDLLDNHEVNLIMTGLMGLVMPMIATPLWPMGFGDAY